MAQALYRKWRPKTWTDLIGQEHVVQTLQNAIQGERIAHAYLFSGPRGTGKTSAARLVAKAINCLAEDGLYRPCNQCANCNAVNQGRFMDMIEIDAASNTSVDDVRDLRDKINFAPSQGQYKIYIIDEVHMLSTAAFNALLKTLEEPPPHAIFILATTEIHKIPATVLSRCQRHEFRRISVNDMLILLNKIVQQENLQIEPAALALIARQSTGALRDAISLLDQLASTGKNITLEFTHQVLGTATSQSVIQLVDAILERRPADGIEMIHKALDSGTDTRQYARQVVEYLRNVLLIHMGNAASLDATAETQATIENHAHRFEREHLLFCVQRFNNAASDTRSNWQPSLSLELAFAECVDHSITPPALQAVQRSAPETAQSLPVKPLAQMDKPIPEPLTHPVKQEQATMQEQVPVKTAPQKNIPENAPAKPAETSTNKEDRLDMKALREKWEEIRQRVRSECPRTEGLLNSCKSISIKNNCIVLGFASDVVKSKMDTKDNISLVSSIISKALETEVTIRCVVVDTNATNATGNTTVEGDSMVNAALGLGGQIVQQD